MVTPSTSISVTPVRTRRHLPCLSPRSSDSLTCWTSRYVITGLICSASQTASRYLSTLCLCDTLRSGDQSIAPRNCAATSNQASVSRNIWTSMLCCIDLSISTALLTKTLLISPAGHFAGCCVYLLQLHTVRVRCFPTFCSSSPSSSPCRSRLILTSVAVEESTRW